MNKLDTNKRRQLDQRYYNPQNCPNSSNGSEADYKPKLRQNQPWFHMALKNDLYINENGFSQNYIIGNTKTKFQRKIAINKLTVNSVDVLKVSVMCI